MPAFLHTVNASGRRPGRFALFALAAYTVRTVFTLMAAPTGPTVAVVSRIGLSVDELLASTWASGKFARYAAHLPGLDVLEGETVALVGEGAGDMVDAFTAALPEALPIDGAIAARGGTLRIHAQQAVRVGVTALAISDPFPGLGPEARALAIADLASLGGLGLTVLVAASDLEAALLFADRVVLLRDGRVRAAYPVVQSHPRVPADVASVRDRLATFAA